jgi:hypothetical protein
VLGEGIADEGKKLGVLERSIQRISDNARSDRFGQALKEGLKEDSRSVQAWQKNEGEGHKAPLESSSRCKEDNIRGMD